MVRRHATSHQGVLYLQVAGSAATPGPTRENDVRVEEQGLWSSGDLDCHHADGERVLRWSKAGEASRVDGAWFSRAAWISGSRLDAAAGQHGPWFGERDAARWKPGHPARRLSRRPVRSRRTTTSAADSARDGHHLSPEAGPTKHLDRSDRWTEQTGAGTG